MSTDVPEAPLLYGADWNVYSSAKYTGWPNQSQPYMRAGRGPVDDSRPLLPPLRRRAVPVGHPGTYTLHAGRSSRDLRLKSKVALRMS